MLLPGKYFTMVEDSIAKRKTPSVLTFCKDKRFYEYQSLAKFAKKKCDQFSYLNRFFEEKGSQSQVFLSSIMNTFRDNFETTEDELGTIFKVRGSNFPEMPDFSRNKTESGDYHIRLEEMYAMLLTNMKNNAVRTAEREFA